MNLVHLPTRKTKLNGLDSNNSNDKIPLKDYPLPSDMDGIIKDFNGGLSKEK